MKSRSRILLDAESLISHERERDYGTPRSSMQCFANLCNQFLVGKYPYGEFHLTAADAAMLLALLKVSRIATSPTPHSDNFIDLAGYAAIAAELQLYMGAPDVL